MKLDTVIELRSVIEEFIDENISIKTAYKFSKFLQDTENDYNFFVQKTQEIIQQYAEKDEEGNFITFPNGGIKLIPEKTKDVENILKDLQNIDILIGDYFKFNIDEFENLKISCRKLNPFMDFIINN